MPTISDPLNADQANELVRAVKQAAETDSKAAAWLLAQRLLNAADELREAAEGIAYLIKEEAFERANAREAAAFLIQDHTGDLRVMAHLGVGFDVLCDTRYFNAAPPQDPPLLKIAEALLRFEQDTAALTVDHERRLLNGLSTAARILGRTWDAVAERCAKRLVAMYPDDWGRHYNLGLFYKQRGRFEEGSEAQQRAFDGGGADVDTVRWNLAICATGAGDAQRALTTWKKVDSRIEIGRFGLPEARYGSVKVRLAARPLAERSQRARTLLDEPNAEIVDEPDDPGLEETVWIEQLSPCHGVIRSALVDDLGVDYGDVVLFDGAPITFHEYAGEQIPVFPHIATLVRPGYRIFRFGGTQEQPRQIAELTGELPPGAMLYTHTEQLRVICRKCWEGGEPHEHPKRQPESQPKHRAVTGKLCAPPDIAPSDLLAMIDSAVAKSGEVQLFIPDLAEAAGDLARARVEGRRLEMIFGSS